MTDLEFSFLFFSAESALAAAYPAFCAATVAATAHGSSVSSSFLTNVQSTATPGTYAAIWSG